MGIPNHRVVVAIPHHFSVDRDRFARDQTPRVCSDWLTFLGLNLVNRSRLSPRHLTGACSYLLANG